MIQKKVVLIVYLLVIMGVFYFIYNVLTSDNHDVPESIVTQSEAEATMKNIGVSDFQTKTLNNSDFKLSQIDASVIIINFWATWCGPCVEEFPSMLSLVREMNGRVALLAISVDSDLDQINLFLKNFDTSMSGVFLLRDPNYYLAESFGTFKIPESYIINKDRKLIKKISGSIDWSDPEIKKIISSNL